MSAVENYRVVLEEAGYQNLDKLADAPEALARAVGRTANARTLEMKEGIDDLLALAKLGHSLSTWAASINWDSRATNTPEWLDGLRQRIEQYQARYDSIIEKALSAAATREK